MLWKTANIIAKILNDTYKAANIQSWDRKEQYGNTFVHHQSAKEFAKINHVCRSRTASFMTLSGIPDWQAMKCLKIPNSPSVPCCYSLTGIANN
jgi:hypothetical protein